MIAAAWALGAVVYLACVAIGMDPPELRGRHRRARERRWSW